MYQIFAFYVKLTNLKTDHLRFKYVKEFLEDDKIVKVGVVPEEDAKLLSEDYGVETKSTLDLRHMAKQVGFQPRSLKIMSDECLKVKLTNNKRISNKWESETLDPKQIDYAAKDALAAIELFKFFANKLQPIKTMEPQKSYVRSVLDNYCKFYYGKRFVYVQTGTERRNKNRFKKSKIRAKNFQNSYQKFQYSYQNSQNP